jgi:hypothetical protein
MAFQCLWMMNTFVSQLLTPVNVKISMPFLGVGKERTMVLTCVLTTSLCGTCMSCSGSGVRESGAAEGACPGFGRGRPCLIAATRNCTMRFFSWMCNCCKLYNMQNRKFVKLARLTFACCLVPDRPLDCKFLSVFFVHKHIVWNWACIVLKKRLFGYNGQPQIKLSVLLKRGLWSKI